MIQRRPHRSSRVLLFHRERAQRAALEARLERDGGEREHQHALPDEQRRLRPRLERARVRAVQKHVRGAEPARQSERADDAALELVVPEVVAHGVAIRHAEDEAGDLGSFHTKRCRGGVERRQLAFKGVEGGD
eukprot:29880-Pelagococcus_subviridis.AAC.2